MGLSFKPPSNNIIKYFPNITIDTDDTSGKGFETGSVYHHFLTAFSFKVNIWAQYKFFGSDRLNTQLWRYSISQKKWIKVNEQPELSGGYDAISNGKWGRISVNCNNQETSGDFNWNENITDSIHWDVMVRKVKGSNIGSDSRVHLVTGNYSTCLQTTYDSICKGSTIIKIPTPNYSWHIQAAENQRPKNPFDEPWGNVTYANGSKIMLGDFPKLIPSKLIK